MYQFIKRYDVNALGFVWVRIAAKHWMVTRVNTKKNCGEEWLATTVLCEWMQQKKQKHFRSLGHVAQECLFRIFLNVH